MLCNSNNKLSAIVFSLFCILAALIYFCGWNEVIFYKINAQYVLLPTFIWSMVNFISDSKHFILPIILLAITFIYKRPLLTKVLILLIVYYVLFSLLKVAIHEARPYISLPSGSFNLLAQSQNLVAVANRSFPSGHTGNMAIFVFTLSSFTGKRWLKLVLFILLILVAIARICTGWHWPLDVISSGLIAYVLVMVLVKPYICKS